MRARSCISGWSPRSSPQVNASIPVRGGSGSMPPAAGAAPSIAIANPQARAEVIRIIATDSSRPPPQAESDLGPIEGEGLRAWSAEVEASSLGRRRHREVGAQVGDAGTDRRLERGVVPPGIVMERHQVLDAGQPGEGQCIVNRAVSPAHVAGVLVAGVLRVVELDLQPHAIAAAQEPATRVGRTPL